jgi:GTP cyclohydrolase II
MTKPEPHVAAVAPPPEAEDAVRVASAVEIPISRAERPAMFYAFEGFPDGAEHVAIGFGEGAGAEPAMVRVHSECLTGDLFGSLRCDCGPQLAEALETISRAGGYILYLRQEGRGIGLNAKLAAYLLQDRGLDTFAANRALHLPEDARSFAPAAAMLKALGVRRIRLLTNNPDKADQLRRRGVEIVETIPTGVHVNDRNQGYLRAKALLRRHTLRIETEEASR